MWHHRRSRGTNVQHMKLSLIRIVRRANRLDRENSGPMKCIVLSQVESEMESGEGAIASLGGRCAEALNF